MERRQAISCLLLHLLNYVKDRCASILLSVRKPDLHPPKSTFSPAVHQRPCVILRCSQCVSVKTNPFRDFLGFLCHQREMDRLSSPQRGVGLLACLHLYTQEYSLKGLCYASLLSYFSMYSFSSWTSHQPMSSGMLLTSN